MISRYILKFDTSGRMLLFTFSILLVGISMIVAFSGIGGGTILDTFKAVRLQTNEELEAIISGLLIICVILFWLTSCLITWGSSFLLSKKLDKGQKLRLTSLYFIAFATIANVLLPLFVFYLPYEGAFHVLMTVLYFAGLKFCDKKISESL
ncbi:MAG: hypothetical protein R3Y43_05135 [Alphaproteobacteria bacterium]